LMTLKGTVFTALLNCLELPANLIQNSMLLLKRLKMLSEIFLELLKTETLDLLKRN
jgi:hypothetical protein